MSRSATECYAHPSKRRYPDKKSAQTAINSANRKRGRRGRAEALRAYHCGACTGWHLTKQEKRALQ